MAGDSYLAQKLEYAVTAANSASMGLIFALRQFLPVVFRGFGRDVLFPFNATANILRAIFALYDARQHYIKPAVEPLVLRIALLRAVVAVLSGLAISTAIIGALVATAAFAVIGPILSVAGFSLRALYNSAIALHFTMDAYRSKTPEQAKDNWSKVLSNGVNALQSALNAIAIAMVLIAFQGGFGIMGIVAAVIGTPFAVYKAATHGSERGNLSSTGHVHRQLRRSQSMMNLHTVNPETDNEGSDDDKPTPLTKSFSNISLASSLTSSGPSLSTTSLASSDGTPSSSSPRLSRNTSFSL